MKDYRNNLKNLSGAALGGLDLSLLLYNKFLPFKNTKFFSGGFGDLSLVNEFEGLIHSYARGHEPNMKVEPFWKYREAKQTKTCRIDNVWFNGPFTKFLPEECHTGSFQLIRPLEGKPLKGIVIHAASTGDSTFQVRKQLIAEPLLEKGIGSLILMIPFYGDRRPKDQKWHFIRSVSDFLINLGATLLEVSLLVDWVRKTFPDLMVGITGISMGGGITGCAGAVTGGDLALSPCLAGHSPSPLVKGALRGQIDWETLSKESRLPKDEVMAHLYELLEKYSIEKLVKSFPVEKVGKRTFVQINARDDYVVEKRSGEKLFKLFSESIGEKRSVLRTIEGGHLSSFMASQYFFVPAILKSFELLEEN
ncbi:MAG: alpha/beta hydrolase family protein [Bdellovibrionota bacterium]|nr:alpha/beta hydrolase family protein [Bdellovibrionota bacterium]